MLLVDDESFQSDSPMYWVVSSVNIAVGSFSHLAEISC